jgi:hypothetical protein
MKDFDITIRATITKTIRVREDNEDKAEELAHQVFNPNEDGVSEAYDQDTLHISEVKE